LTPEKDPCLFRLFWRDQASFRRKEIQEMFLGVVEKRPCGVWACLEDGSEFRWLWKNLNPEASSPVLQFKKLCAARTCPPVSHFPFGARYPGDPLQPTFVRLEGGEKSAGKKRRGKGARGVRVEQRFEEVPRKRDVSSRYNQKMTICF
jgi:hypothetical protein